MPTSELGDKQKFEGAQTSVAINALDQVMAACIENEEIVVKRFSINKDILAYTQADVVANWSLSKNCHQ